VSDRSLLAWLLAAVLALAFTGMAGAQELQAQPMQQDPALELRVMDIAAELRCLVCQNETIAASHADLAVDLRAQIRNKLQQGQTPDEIRDFMVERYGDFVLYRPPLKASTLPLWAGPFVLLLVAALAMAATIRERRRAQAAQPLTPEQRLRARQLLGQDTLPKGEAGP
jgi:cytochrome c-type biogenesis protein CcmH